MASKQAELILKIRQVGGNVLGKIKAGLGSIANAAKVAGVAMVAGLGVSLKAFREQELSVNKLNRAMIQQGIFTPELSKEYQNMASELQKLSTFGDEATLTAMASLQAFAGQEKVTKELVKATQDLAAATGMDLNAAAQLVGKSIGTSTNALARYGVALEAGATKQEKINQFIESSNGLFGGQAEVMAKGSGAFIQFKNAAGDVLEKIGEAFAPMLTALATKLTTFVEKLQTSKKAMDGLRDAAKLVGQTFIIVKGVFQVVGEVIGATLGTIAGGITQIVEGEFRQALETLKSGFSDNIDIVKEQLITSREELNELDATFKQEDQTKRDEERALITQNEQQKLAIKKKAIDDEKILKDKARKKEEKDTILAEFKKNTMAKLSAQQRLSLLQSSFSQIATLQQSKEKGLFRIGQAAAVANAVINTAQGATKALALGPFIGPALAAAIVAAGAVQIGVISSQQPGFEEGGLVRGTQGGTSGIIGEGGQDELIVPLDDVGGLGGGITIIVNGGLLGDESSAREFAVAVDEELFKLRQSNESISLEGLI